MKVRRHVKSIIGILRRRDDTWTTIHARWDMELFSYLFSSEDEDEIDDRKTYLANACTSIFELIEKRIIDKHFSPAIFYLASVPSPLSVISSLFELAGESRIPINIVNDVASIPDYIANDEDAMYSIHLYGKSGAYLKLKMYDEMLFECNEALRMNQNGIDFYG